MPTVIEEEFLRFEFGDDWYVVKYDEHADYTEQMRKLQETKAVDFTAIMSDQILHFIEVKDFRGHRIENRVRFKDGEIAIEVGQKVRDTIAGIVAAHHRGGSDDWERFCRCLSRREPPVKVVLWLEDDLPATPRGRSQNRAKVLTDALKQQLRWLTTKVLVVCMATPTLDGLNVTNLPGAGHRTSRGGPATS